MTRLEAITEAYLLATGKTALPVIGSAKRNQLTNLAMKFYRDWQTEPGIEWESLKLDVSAGTATATGLTYELDTEINFISKDENNYVFIGDTKYRVVSKSQLNKYKYSNAVAHIVEEGVHSIQFSKALGADNALVGQEIFVPSVIKLDDITVDASEIYIDKPGWLAERVAAQYCYSYKSLRDMYDDLLALANESMTSMKMNNESGNASYHTEVDYFATVGNVGDER